MAKKAALPSDTRPLELPEIPDVQPMEEQVKAIERLWDQNPVVFAKPIDRNVVPATASIEVDTAKPDVQNNVADGATPPDEQAAHVAMAPARPWLVLVAVAFGLFASLGLNVYLGWLLSDIRRRYHVLIHQQMAPSG